MRRPLLFVFILVLILGFFITKDSELDNINKDTEITITGVVKDKKEKDKYTQYIIDGYLVSDDGETFIEYSGDAEYYLNLFNQNDKNYHYEIKLKDNRICKFYKYDYSLMSALDEFIRFFIYLDTYMRDNNIV